MKIYVKDSKDQICTIEGIAPNTLVKDLKKKVIKENRITTGNINLIFNSYIFDDDDQNLDYYGLEEGNTIIYLGEFPAGLKRKKKNNYYIFI